MTRPGHWLWSHDIKPDQIASLGPAGWTLMSLSSYGDGDRRRFAAVLHKGPGAGRLPVLDLEPSQIGARLQHARVSPVAITVKAALLACVTVRLSGCCAICGGILTVNTATTLVAAPAGLLTTTS